MLEYRQPRGGCKYLIRALVKISVKPVDIALVQVYMPTTNHDDDDEIEKLYEEISEILHQEGRGQVNAIVMGDFNSIVGEGSTDKVVGPFGIGRRNERGKMVIDFSSDEYVVQENKNEAVCMEKPRRQESIPNRLHSGEATL